MVAYFSWWKLIKLNTIGWDSSFGGKYICVALTVSRYEAAKAKGTDNYDRELEDAIDRLIVECDRKIVRALKRLEDDDAKAAIAISVSEVTQVMIELFAPLL